MVNLLLINPGLGFARLVDPSSSVDIGIVGEVYYLAAIVLFLAQDGHLMVMQLLIQTFDTIPLATSNFFNVDLNTLTKFAGHYFLRWRNHRPTQCDCTANSEHHFCHYDPQRTSA